MTKLDSKRFSHLGRFLKVAREKKPLSQGAVAKKLGYKSPQFVSNFERGLCSPPLKQLRTLVDLYDISAEDLIRVIAEDQKVAMRDSLKKLKKVLRVS